MNVQKLKSQINMFGVLRNLETITRLDTVMQNIVLTMDYTIALMIVDGSEEVAYRFNRGSISLVEDVDTADLSFEFDSANHFNNFIKAAEEPAQISGDKDMIEVTNSIFERFRYFCTLDSEKIKQPGFLSIYRIITLQSQFLSIPPVSMLDDMGKIVASHLPDGSYNVLFGKEIALNIKKKGAVFSSGFGVNPNPIVVVKFKDIPTAFDYIQGKVHFREAVPLGAINVKGIIIYVATFLKLLSITRKYFA